jgi:group I intron endonuclease
MANHSIYVIRCAPSGKVYIGQTSRLSERRASHFSCLRNGKHGNKYLQAAFDKYGEACFQFAVLDECNECVVDARESDWIQLCKSMDHRYGFNLESGGHKNKTLAAETKAIMSKQHTGMKHSEAAKRKISLVQLGKRLSDAHKEKISKANRGRVLSDESRRRMSLAQYNRSAEHSAKIQASRNAYFARKKAETCARATL